MTVKAYNITSSVQSVTGAITSTPLFGQNTGSKQRIVVNDQGVNTANLFIKFGTGASATSYTVKVPPNGYYEFPSTNGVYAGPVEGIWDAATGTARTTEYW
jgi:hypothetical protein